jgi:hypothetical protein
MEDRVVYGGPCCTWRTALYMEDSVVYGGQRCTWRTALYYENWLSETSFLCSRLINQRHSSADYW